MSAWSQIWLLSWRWKILAYHERNQQYAADVYVEQVSKLQHTVITTLQTFIGSTEYNRIYIQEKISQWIKELQMLSKIAWLEPQAAYSCSVTGFKQKPTFYMRTTPNISNHVKQSDEPPTTEFIPAITGGINCSHIERKLMSIPLKLGRMEIPNFSDIADREYEFSQMLSNDLTSKIINQERQHQPNDNSIVIKTKIKLLKLQHHQKKLLDILLDIRYLLLKILLSSNNASTVWIKNKEHQFGQPPLITLPIKEGYDLSKQLFWDLVRMRYDWTVSRLPSVCECGMKFDLTHALSCKKGGFVLLKCNYIRNITAALLTEVCKDVRVEPLLYLLTGESLQHHTARGGWG